MDAYEREQERLANKYYELTPAQQELVRIAEARVQHKIWNATYRSTGKIVWKRVIPIALILLVGFLAGRTDLQKLAIFFLKGN